MSLTREQLIACIRSARHLHEVADLASHCAEDLQQRIRAAGSLQELTRYVGPSTDDLIAQQLRGLAVAQLRSRHGPDLDAWPPATLEQYQLMCRQQQEHEERYGQQVAPWAA